MDDGSNIHLVLPQIEMFNMKLEQAQREMGKMPGDFVPIKYSNIGDEGEANPALRIAIGACFVGLCIQLYRTLHGKGSSSAKSGGGMMGRGGFGGQNPMGQMGKSNVQVYGLDKKIKVRFKHVAGMESAKTEVTEFVDFLKNP